MKKLLIGTSALVAAGLVAGAAHAADPIKLNVGGFAGTWVLYAEQDDDFLGAGAEQTAVDVKGDVEVIFTGSTTLDNGLKVSFKTEMEAGGRTTSKVIDEYNVSVAGSFGTVVMGADDTALAAIAVTSPRVGGRLYGGAFSEGDNVDGFNIMDELTANSNRAPNASFINTGADSETISYISPSFGGFTVGATYMPDAGQSRNDYAPAVGLSTPAGSGNTADAYGVGAAYNGEFAGVGVKVAGGWLTADTALDEYNEYQFGANVSYAGFTFGGGARLFEEDGESEAFAWDLGVSYKTGPYGVSLAYFDGRRGNVSGVDEDTRQVWELNGEYTMGPGVALVGGVGYASFEDNSGPTATAPAGFSLENDGFFASTGITLSF